jgi:predicted ribosome quality control (RQC) complex YloA/Tae2 family protein
MWTLSSKLKPKSSLSALDLRALTREVGQLIVGGTIVNVYMIGSLLTLKIRCADGISRILAIKPPRWISLTSYDFEKPAQPPPFCMLLRKLMRGARITSFEQVGFDRIVRMRTEGERGAHELMVELVREGNLVVCDSNSTVLGAYREVEYKDRALKRGARYQLPPNALLDVDEGRALEVLRDRKPKAFYAALALVGSPEVAYEVLARCSTDPESEVGSREDVERIAEKARELLASLDVLKPSIVYVDGRPFSVVPIDFTIYAGCEKRAYDRFYDAVADYFYEEFKESLQRGKEEVEKERRRIEATIKEVERSVAEVEAKIKRLSRAISFVEENAESFQELLEAFKEAWARGEDRPSPEPRVEGVKVVGVDRRGRTVKVEVEGLELSLKPHESLMSNVSSLYDELKELKRKLEASRRALADLEAKLESLVEREVEMAKEVEGRIRKRREPKYWYERYLWFRSSDEFLVVAGRDASQNEALVRRYLEDRDLFFHADVVGAAAVVVKSEGKDVPSTTIEEAAQFAACYSKAWREGFASIDVYWVYGEQVSKTPPSGEYLPKGSFMIRGGRNYLRGVELRLAVGLVVRDGEALVVSGPPSAIARKAAAHVTLVPGDEERGRVARRIAKIFNEHLRAMGFEGAITMDEVARVLPPGAARIVERKSLRGTGET